MERSNRRRVDQALMNAASVIQEQRQKILDEQQQTGKPLGKLLVEKGLVSEEKMISVMEKQLNITRVNLLSKEINYSIIDCIPIEMARRHKVIPLSTSSEKLVLVMADPLNLAAIDDVAMVSGREVVPVIASEIDIANALDHYCSMSAQGQKDHKEQKNSFDQKEKSPDMRSKVNDAPIVKMVNSMISRALEEEASDLHLEPTNEGLRIRMRVDGVLHDLAFPPRFKQDHIISRVKIMADLDIAEKRMAQDGNIQHEEDNKIINLRVSTMPTINGEKVVIRILERKKIILPLEKLGFSPANHRAFQRLLLNQSGMVLVTGPTGCGKTTTLYSALNYLNKPKDNIITVEDPVEYRLKGINQIQVNRRINRTFANTLRSILRQDPDIIMVGEIRDLETVKIATQAALTGHLVLSTLHTNSAAGAVARLTDMGLEPFMVTASTVGVVAQRLIRKICPHCIEEYHPDVEENHFYCKYFKKEPPSVLYRGAKCNRCNQTGYRGRTLIQELMVLNQDLQDLILQKAPALIIQQKAVEQGMLTLISDGLRCLEAGVTTVGEAVRATFSSVFDNEITGYAENSLFFARLHEESS